MTSRPTGETTTYNTNMAVFTRLAPRHAEAVEASTPDPALQPVTTRDGCRSFALSESSSSDGVSRVRNLHSAYAPVREAERLVRRAVPREISIVVQLGLGAAFPIRAILEQHSHIIVIAVERSWQTVRTIFEWIDLSGEIASGRLRITVSPEDLAGEIPACYFPALREGARVLRLQPWTDHPRNREHFETCGTTARALLDTVAGDLGPVRRFSYRWLVHTVHNTHLLLRTGDIANRKRMRVASPLLEQVQHRCRGAETLVLAAGPGFDTMLSGVSDRFDSETRPLIAVDTVAPALLQRGIYPTAVVTLDPQPWTVLHSRPPLPAETLLCVDLGVGTAVPRDQGNRNILWFIGLHPLHRLLHHLGAPLHPLMNPAQSVTEAAIQLAWSFGSRQVSVLGADAGYPRAQTYARGTYHYSIAGRLSTRRTPEEHFFAHQVYPRCEISSGTVHEGPGPVFTTTAFQQRKHRIDTAARRSPDTRDANAISSRNTKFDPRQFWIDHCGTLSEVIHSLRQLQGESLPPVTDIVQNLGPHGMAHLPVIARALRARSETDAQVSLISTVVETLETIRGYILEENNRY